MTHTKTHLALAAVGAAATANAWRPFARRGQGAMLSFSSGVVTSELPLPTLAGQALVAGAAVLDGAHRTPVGRAGLALTAASWAGLVGLHADARRAGPIVERALVEALGADYRSRMAEPRIPHEEQAGGARHALFQSARARKRYIGARNVSYGQFGKRNQLDVWRRRDLPLDGRAPVLIQVHGGAWTMGSKDWQALPLMSHLAERGWVCVAINYRLAPAVKWPEIIVDVKRAIAWVKEHIADHGGDPNFVAITGGSAGGHLSALAALTADDRDFQPGFEDVDTGVQAAVPFYGVYDLTDRERGERSELVPFLEAKVFPSHLADDAPTWERASPLYRVSAEAPPFFVLHGQNDSLVPIEQGRALVARLRAESTSPTAYAELPRAQHSFESFHSVRATHAVRAVERFLAVVYGDHRRTGAAGRRPTPDQLAAEGAVR